MCLCSEARRAKVSFVDFAERVGAPTKALREWERRTPCYCDKFDAVTVRRLATLFNVWSVLLETEEKRNAHNADL
jgi:hypothetical protein